MIVNIITKVHKNASKTTYSIGMQTFEMPESFRGEGLLHETCCFSREVSVYSCSYPEIHCVDVNSVDYLRIMLPGKTTEFDNTVATMFTTNINAFILNNKALNMALGFFAEAFDIDLTIIHSTEPLDLDSIKKIKQIRSLKNGSR